MSIVCSFQGSVMQLGAIWQKWTRFTHLSACLIARLSIKSASGRQKRLPKSTRML